MIIKLDFRVFFFLLLLYKILLFLILDFILIMAEDVRKSIETLSKYHNDFQLNIENFFFI